MNLPQQMKYNDKEKISKKENYTDTDLETQDNPLKLSNQKLMSHIEDDEFWNDCGKKNVSEVSPNKYN